MKKGIKIGSGLIMVIVIAGILGYFFIYNKPHRNFEKANPDFKIDALEFFGTYINDRQNAETTYNGKVVELTGVLQRIENPDSLMIAVFVFQEGMFGDEGIRCTMLPNYHQETLNLQSMEIVTIKGYCAGYNDTDLILEKCSLIAPKVNNN